jgi:hypothetical protein
MESIQYFLRDILAVDRVDINQQAHTLMNLVAIAWSIHLINWAVASGGLNLMFGIHPRRLRGIPGIFCSPFFHVVRKNAANEVIDGGHIIGNTIVFAPLALFISLQGIEFFNVVSIAVLLSDGIGTWLFGRDRTYHVGASGVIYGYLGFLLIYGMTSGQFVSFFIGIFVLWLYGGVIQGILPSGPGVSWEGHLFGFLGGCFMALLLSDIKIAS